MTRSLVAESRPSTPLRLARLAVATVFFANSLVFANWIVRIPDVKGRLRLSEGALGLALLAMAAGALLAQLLAAWLIARLGSRRTVMLMALVFCAAATLPGLASSLPLLMLALLLFGAGNGGLDVAMNAQAAQVERDYGRPIMSSFHGLWSAAGLVGAALGGLIAERGLAVEVHMLLAALTAGALLLIASRGLLPGRGDPCSSGPLLTFPPRVLLPMGLIAFCVLLSEGAVGDWSAIYLREDLGSTPAQAARGYAVFALLMAAGRFSGDWLTLRFGPRRVVLASGLLIIAGVALLLLDLSASVAIAGFGLIGAGAACVFPLVLSAAARTPGIAPGRAISAIATSGYTGFLVGPPLIGYVAETLSLRAALGLLGLVGLLTVVLARSVEPKE